MRTILIFLVVVNSIIAYSNFFISDFEYGWILGSFAMMAALFALFVAIKIN